MRGICTFTFDLGELVRQTDSEHTENVSYLCAMLCRKEQSKINTARTGSCAARNSTARRYACAALVLILTRMSSTINITSRFGFLPFKIVKPLSPKVERELISIS